MDTIKNTWHKKPMVIILSAILILAIILLLVVVILQAVVFRNNNGAKEATAVIEQTAALVEPGSSEGTEAQAPTPTATVVVKDPTATPLPAPTATPKPTSTPKSSAPSAGGSTGTGAGTAVATEPEIGDVMKNGGFESGFGDDGVAEQWHHFTNDSAKYIFASEVWPLAIRDGKQAQRITIFEATQPNRYAGIYQTAPVVPGKTYQLSLHGQIRSRAGNIAVSNYGYRMQYAVDYEGGEDWQSLPEKAWVELPWDEQLLDDANVKFLDYSAKLTPTGERVTIFVRAWNKWADPVEAQYTLDTISLTGPKPVDALVDQPLPSTGATPPGLPTDPRIWGGLALLVFLIGGAAWRAREAANQRMM